MERCEATMQIAAVHIMTLASWWSLDDRLCMHHWDHTRWEAYACMCDVRGPAVTLLLLLIIRCGRKEQQLTCTAP